jgi:hypothetical protein
MPLFSGSYLPSDVQFLLKPIQLKATPLKEKEQLIQTGKKHYSEMISPEALPTPAYLALFHQLFRQNHARLATDLLTLARKIHQHKSKDITLISLARAGTPIGVLLKRILQRYFNRHCAHYSLSIIRDRGIDNNALRYILKRHSEQSLTFIDGWTGKGVITHELKKSIADFNRHYQTTISSDLYVLNDIAGVAAVTASFEDYLIPSCLLNATISGLISRSILNQEHIAPDDFHGCLYYNQFAAYDLSHWFIEQMMATVAPIFHQRTASPLKDWQSYSHANHKQHIQQQALSFMAELKKTYGIQNEHLIKPGIGEATRVLLRRVPDLLLLKNKQALETQHLRLLANEKRIPILENSTMPYQAVSIITKIHHD